MQQLADCTSTEEKLKADLSRDIRSTSAPMLAEVSVGERTELLSRWLTAPLDMPGEPAGPNLCHFAVSHIQITSDTCRCSLHHKAELGRHPVSTLFPQNTRREHFL